MAAAAMSEQAVTRMLIEQEIQARADALLNSAAFTTAAQDFEAMATAAGDANFDRLVESLVQDAGRAAESVASTVRPNIWHIRYVTPPCCGRCAVLAGRVYRFSEGFLRHPNCDCVMVPTVVAAPVAQSPDTLFENGDITDLSKADARAIRDGANLTDVVNVRRKQAGLTQAGEVLKRGSRLTPAGIYRLAADDREKAVELLIKAGYVHN